MEEDAYVTLGLLPAAEPEVVAAAYAALAAKYQDDAERLERLERAYERIGDPEARRGYDAERAQRRAPARASGPAAGSTVGDEVVSLLVDRGLEVVDKRASGGALWVIGGEELGSVLEAFKERGVTFKFQSAGGRATKQRPAWWTK